MYLRMTLRYGSGPFEVFARIYFSDPSPEMCKASSTLLRAPLLKQVFGDGDAARVVSVWSGNQHDESIGMRAL